MEIEVMEQSEFIRIERGSIYCDILIKGERDKMKIINRECNVLDKEGIVEYQEGGTKVENRGGQWEVINHHQKSISLGRVKMIEYTIEGEKRICGVKGNQREEWKIENGLIIYDEQNRRESTRVDCITLNKRMKENQQIVLVNRHRLYLMKGN